MKRTHQLMLRTLSVVIVGLLLIPTGAAGQSPSGLAIQILQANDRENLTDKELPPMKVRVMDRTGRVIPEASVLFQAPEDGPTGIFLPDSSQIRVFTDTQGVATAPRFRTNSKVGDYQIQIVATYRDTVSKAVIPQTNLFKLKSSNKKFFILSTVIGGAAAAALVSRRGSSGPVSSALESLAVTPTLTVGGSSSGPIPLTLAPISQIPSADTVSTPAPSSTVSTPAPSSTVSPVATSGSTTTASTVQPTTVTPSVPSSCSGKSKSKSCR